MSAQTHASRVAGCLTAAVLSLMAAVACVDPSRAHGTSLFVVTTYDEDLTVDQLSVEVQSPDETWGPAISPAIPGDPLASGQSVRVLLPEAAAGRSLTVRVTGLRAGDATASGTRSVVARSGLEVEVHVSLQPTSMDPDAGRDVGAEPDGGLDGGEDAGREPDAGCGPCDAKTSDGCLGTGTCTCGTGDACAAGQACIGGRCICTPETCTGCCDGDVCRSGNESSSCGAGGAACEACPGSQTCADGRCSGCTPESCPNGCCSGATCVVASLSSCGTAGAACGACNPVLADVCANGVCQCGADAACEAGQRCVGGACICDGTSCPGGCCDGATCLTRTLQTCGSQGATCLACDAVAADNCSGLGTCQCGTNAPCGAGQRCASGQCICDATSCPDGCCAGETCLPGDLTTACGTGGAACQSCPGGGACTNGVCDSCNAATCPGGCCSGGTCSTPSMSACGQASNACVVCDALRADTCSNNGTCQCGVGAPCLAGQRCVGGACVCDGASCQGCCSNGMCLTGTSFDSCGTGGNACETCDPLRAKSCGNGICKCGGKSVCAPGQRCAGSSCVCDATSCPNGCCVGSTCVSPTTAACGIGGTSCGTCNPLVADTCALGSCRCGSGAPCSAGQTCVEGTCTGP